MKTIRQIADEIGVSKQAVHKKIKKEPLSTELSGLMSTVDGVVHISVGGEKIIKSTFAQKQSTMVADNAPTTVDSDVVVLLRDNLDVLKAQLKEKDRQLSEKDKQIEFLQNAFKTEQALHAGTLQKQLSGGQTVDADTLDEGEALADELEAENFDSAKPLTEPIDKTAKPGIFGKLFGRKK